MKNFIFVFVFFFFQVTLSGQQQYTFDQSVAVIANMLGQLESFDLVDFDIVSIKKGQSYLWDITLTVGETYHALAVSQEGIKDLGLYIYDKYDRLITTDHILWNDGFTFASVTANYTSRARIKATILSSQRKRQYKIGLILVKSTLGMNEFRQLLRKNEY